MSNKLKYFLSFAFNDDDVGVGGGTGWVTQFQSDLQVQFTKSTGMTYREDYEYFYTKNRTNNAEIPKLVDGEILESHLLVAVVSPSFIKSDWCKYEVDGFLRKPGRKPFQAFLVRLERVSCKELSGGKLANIETRDFFATDGGVEMPLNPKDHGLLYRRELTRLAKAMHDSWCELTKAPPALTVSGSFKPNAKSYLVDGATDDRPLVEKIALKIKNSGANVGLVPKEGVGSRYSNALVEWRNRVVANDVVVLVREKAAVNYVETRAIDAARFIAGEERNGLEPGRSPRKVVVIDAGKGSTGPSEELQQLQSRVRHIQVRRPNPGECANEVLRAVAAS